ncbi:MAG: hypothetical protein ABH812_02350 [bacterium]
MKKLYRKFKPYVILTFIVLITTFILWLPFVLRVDSWFGLKIDNPGFQNVYQNYDGPLYTIASKTLYDPLKISPPDKGLIVSLPLTNEYFAAHLPLYPLAIRIFSPFVGYLKSMLITNVLFAIFFAWLFYFFLEKFKIKNPLTLTTVCLMMPRFLVVRSIGAPETLLMFLILSSLYFFEKKKYLLSGLLGGLSIITKSPGIILFFTYSFVFIERFIKERKITFQWKWLNILWIPIFFLFLCYFYYLRYGDFFLYFKLGNLIPLVFPFSVFNFQAKWVDTAWLNDIVFYYLIFGLTIIYLYKNKMRSLFYFSLIFFLSILFLQHKDIARHSLPLWPLSIIALNKFFSSKAFLAVFWLIIVPASLFYSWNFILYNRLPIADWAPYL